MNPSKSLKQFGWFILIALGPFYAGLSWAVNQGDHSFSQGALAGGVGAFSGLFIWALFKDTSLVTRLVLSGLLWLFSVIIARNSAPEVRDLPEVYDQWDVYSLGFVTFENPRPLQLQINHQEEIQWGDYQVFEVFMDDEELPGRVTICHRLELKTGSFPIRDAFNLTLQGMISSLGHDPETIQFFDEYQSVSEVSRSFTVRNGGKVLSGFGFIAKQDLHAAAVWLIPGEQGFSREYIRQFRNGIKVAPAE